MLYMRKGMGLEKHFGRAGNKESVKCGIIDWNDHKELLAQVLNQESLNK